jgi:hypothetical protein
VRREFIEQKIDNPKLTVTVLTVLTVCLIL